MSHPRDDEERRTPASESDADDTSSTASSEQFEPFDSDADAAAARQTALDLYNAGKLEEAAELQSRILAHFTKAEGDDELSPKLGLYYLDYGMTLLDQVRTDSVDNALAGNLEGGESKEEEMNQCFAVLDCARVCFEKKLDASDEADTETTLRLAEAHHALGELCLERDDSDSALQELETALAHREEVLEPKDKRIISTLLFLGEAYLMAEEVAQAEAKYEEALKRATDAGMGADEPLVQELNARIEDLQAFKKGEVDAAKEQIRELFPDEADCVQEAVVDTPNNKAPMAATGISPEEAARPTGAAGIPLLSTRLPDEVAKSNSASLPRHMSAMPGGDGSASVSFFPQQYSRGPAHVAPSAGDASAECPAIATVVNRVVSIKKKTRPAAAAATGASPAAAVPIAAAAPALKKARTEA